MKPYLKTHTGLCGLILILGLLTCAVGNAMHGGGGGGGRGGDFNRDGDYNRGGDYNRDGDNNRGGYRDGVYYDNGADGPGVVVGVPEGESSSTCSTVQQCDDDGNCVQSQVCN